MLPSINYIVIIMPPFVPITTQVNCPVMDLLSPLISTISYVDFMLGNI